MFGEKREENGMEVFQSPKYIQSREFAVELINSKKYDIGEGDFWILMNKTKTGKMMYTGLIISHNGCLKINDRLENKFDPHCVTIDKDGFGDSLVYTYIDDDVYEVGEVSKANCQNAYPYAMALKRCFDRVVLKKSKLAFYGVYSDSEADEFKAPEETPKEEPKRDRKVTASELSRLLTEMGKKHVSAEQVCERYNVSVLEDLMLSQYNMVLVDLSKTRAVV